MLIATTVPPRSAQNGFWMAVALVVEDMIGSGALLLENLSTLLPYTFYSLVGFTLQLSRPALAWRSDELRLPWPIVAALTAGLVFLYSLW